jgi:hypothetical protein
MTEQFVVVGTAHGALLHYLLPDLEAVNEYRHPGERVNASLRGHHACAACMANENAAPRLMSPCYLTHALSHVVSSSRPTSCVQLLSALAAGGAIARVWPQPDGVRCVFSDATGAALLFSALNDAAVLLPGLERAADCVLWDAADPLVVAAHGGGELLAYVAVPPPLAPPGPQLLCRAALPATHVPLVLLNGAVTCRVRNGALDSIMLESHTALQGGPPDAAVGAGAKGSLQKR